MRQIQRPQAAVAHLERWAKIMNTKKRIVLLSMIAAIAVLVVREFGYLGLALYRSRRESSSWQQSMGGSLPTLLTKDEEHHKADWHVKEVSGYSIYYSEESVRPWTRWLPLMKIGTTKISREYFVTSARGKVLSGKNGAEVSLAVYGFLSARGYVEMAEGLKRGQTVNFAMNARGS